MATRRKSTPARLPVPAPSPSPPAAATADPAAPFSPPLWRRTPLPEAYGYVLAREECLGFESLAACQRRERRERQGEGREGEEKRLVREPANGGQGARTIKASCGGYLAAAAAEFGGLIEGNTPKSFLCKLRPLEQRRNRREFLQSLGRGARDRRRSDGKREALALSFSAAWADLRQGDTRPLPPSPLRSGPSARRDVVLPTKCIISGANADLRAADAESGGGGKGPNDNSCSGWSSRVAALSGDLVVMTPPCVGTPRGPAWVSVRSNFRGREDTVLHFMPYFGDDDDGEVDVSAFDVVPDDRVAAYVAESTSVSVMLGALHRQMRDARPEGAGGAALRGTAIKGPLDSLLRKRTLDRFVDEAANTLEMPLEVARDELRTFRRACTPARTCGGSLGEVEHGRGLGGAFCSHCYLYPGQSNVFSCPRVATENEVEGGDGDVQGKRSKRQAKRDRAAAFIESIRTSLGAGAQFSGKDTSAVRTALARDAQMVLQWLRQHATDPWQKSPRDSTAALTPQSQSQPKAPAMRSFEDACSLIEKALYKDAEPPQGMFRLRRVRRRTTNRSNTAAAPYADADADTDADADVDADAGEQDAPRDIKTRRGCRCRKGFCRTSSCPCFAAKRSCDPRWCQTCGSSMSAQKRSMLEEIQAFVRKGLKDEPYRLPVDLQDSISAFLCFQPCCNSKMLHGFRKRVAVGRSSIHGWGVFAREEIQRNDFVYEYSGEIISQQETDRRGKIYDKLNCSFLFNLNDHHVVDATLYGSKIRFANHSDNPNCYARVERVAGEDRIGIYAYRKIHAEEELTLDYAYVQEPDGPIWSLSNFPERASSEDDDASSST
uniref:SET domain-containing protein n=1 Tax=Phaeomonas parva TaxID=124430 RepID=A0A7S1U8C3_9STRA|mmetsp:Transcript_33111/g.104764  ORF Transcript_33111/g.104764 Transcript_33111/m.104764 type:complete len:835 (+) Transcript_33111:93-2597(+)